MVYQKIRRQTTPNIQRQITTTNKLPININKYMEIRTTYKQTHDMVIPDKRAYKQHHSHDFLIITTDKDLNKEYATFVITEYYKQARTKKDKPAHENRFITFLINYHPERARLIMYHAGCTQKKSTTLTTTTTQEDKQPTTRGHQNDHHHHLLTTITKVTTMTKTSLTTKDSHQRSTRGTAADYQVQREHQKHNRNQHHNDMENNIPKEQDHDDHQLMYNQNNLVQSTCSTQLSTHSTLKLHH
eukprot:257253-Amphidinium_carterae.1